MNRALVLAAFLGLAASKSVSAFDYYTQMNPLSIANWKYFTLDFFGDADFGYGSHYAAHGPTSDGDRNTESYGVHFYSWLEGTFQATFSDNHYSW